MHIYSEENGVNMTPLIVCQNFRSVCRACFATLKAQQRGALMQM